jgi:hypothetical protein
LRRRHQPAESDGRVGLPKDLDTLDDGSVREHPVDSRHNLVGVEPVGTGIGGRLGDVFELDAPAITLLKEPDLA